MYGTQLAEDGVGHAPLEHVAAATAVSPLQ
jgi:hypothetical protein